MSASDAERSLEAALDELYGVAPEEFVSARKRLAGDLRAAGERDSAKSLAAARRPTTAAWALNQMSRRQPDVVEGLLDRSRDLQAALADDHDAVREATRAQRSALAAATDAALAQLGERASEAFRAQILATLHAASADESVGEGLRAGRLVREVSGSTGFPEGPGLTLVPDLVTKAPPERVKAPTTKRALATTKRDDGATKEADAERRRTEQARERRALEQAQHRIDAAEAEAADAQASAEAAESAAAEARERVLQLQGDLDAARRDARRTDDAAAQARREATRLARVATKLRSQPEGSRSRRDEN